MLGRTRGNGSVRNRTFHAILLPVLNKVAVVKSAKPTDSCAKALRELKA